MKRPQYDSNNLCTVAICKAPIDEAHAPDCPHNDVKRRSGQLTGRALLPEGHTDTVGIFDVTTR